MGIVRMAPLEEIVCDQDLEDHPAVSHFVGMVLLGAPLRALSLEPSSEPCHNAVCGA